ncbi:MAG: response regulator [Vulcanimicrobiota bacterium]
MQSILVLEDDEDLRDIVVTLLREADYRAEGASNPEEALQLAREQSFYLILSDVRMAGAMDGVAVIEEVKKLQPGIRSVVMTGYADRDAPVRAARIRADEYLRKPFEMDVLLGTVERLLSQTRPFRGLFSRLLEASAGAAQRARRWIFDGRLGRLNQVRADCLQRFYLVIRSGQRSDREVYPYFCQLEKLELSYLQATQPQAWAELTQAYEALEEALLAGQAPSLEASDTLPFPLMVQLYEKILRGRLELGHLQQAVLLLHDPEARRSSLEAYCSYHWLWSPEGQGSDPFEGKVVGGYRLERRRLAACTRGRLYDARPQDGVESGDLVLCLPADEESKLAAGQEVRSGQCRLLQEDQGHYFLLYAGESRSLARRIPPQGLDPAQAWELLRPVFQQVYRLHQQGRCCGHFGQGEIELLPQQPPRIQRFDAKAFSRLAAEIDSGHLLATPRAAPEVVAQFEPTPRSDQFCLGVLLFQALLGRGIHDFPSSYLLCVGSPGVDVLWQDIVPRLGCLAPAVYRLLQADPGRRFSDLRAAASTCDHLLAESNKQ